MLVDRGDARLCEECGEPMEVVRDYGLAGQALTCKACGFYAEEIDRSGSRLSQL